MVRLKQVVGIMKTDLKPIAGLRPASCRYGLSKVPFRGPRRRTDGRYVAFLGGAETFGQDGQPPFPDLIEEALGEVCVNLGSPKAGPDLFVQDTAVRALVHDASAVVIQILGATNLSNRYYRVHPRRNDRFVAPNEALRALYPEVDFTEIAFTGHLVARLREVDPLRFIEVRKVLQATWLRRMTGLIAEARGPVHLLWLGQRQIGDPAVDGAAPVFITGTMIDTLKSLVAGVIEAGQPDHQGVARALLPALRRSLT